MTGNLIEGTRKALGKGLGDGLPAVTAVNATPNGVVEVSVGSQVAFDDVAGQYYMAKTGTSWVKLGSIA